MDYGRCAWTANDILFCLGALLTGLATWLLENETSAGIGLIQWDGDVWCDNAFTGEVLFVQTQARGPAAQNEASSHQRRPPTQS